MNKIGKTTILVMLAGLILTACSGGFFRQGGRIDDTTWLLTHIRGNLVLVGTQPTLRFEAGQVSGNGSCNSFGGEYGQTGSKLTFGPLMSTMMACEPMEIMDQEQAYLAALSSADEFSLEDGTLQIFDSDGYLVLSFSVQDTSLAGKTWQMTTYHDKESGGILSVLAGSTVTAQFADGTLSGSSGCNQYSASYTLEDKNLSIGPAAGTEMYCMDPVGVMEQERGYLDALARTATYRVEGSRLTLLDASGGVVAEFNQVP